MAIDMSIVKILKYLFNSEEDNDTDYVEIREEWGED